jgi:hypothetical protein
MSPRWLSDLSATLVSAIALAGCNSSDNSTTPSSDGGRAPDTSIGGGDDTGTGVEGSPCIPSLTTLSGLEGGAFDACAGFANCYLPCLQSACTAQFAQCSANCECNNLYLPVLECAAAPSMHDLTTCFGPLLIATDMASTATLSCLASNDADCVAKCPVCADAGDAGG